MGKQIIREIDDSTEFANNVISLAKEIGTSPLHKKFYAKREDNNNLFFTGFSVAKQSNDVEEKPDSTTLVSYLNFEDLLNLTTNIYGGLSVGSNIDAILHHSSNTGININFALGNILIDGLNQEEVSKLKESLEAVKKETRTEKLKKR